MLEKLPQYEPPVAVWDNIERQLPLLTLPTHEPPVQIWERIENQLPLLDITQYEPPQEVWTAIENQLPLMSLNQYEPTIDVWSNIENALKNGENEAKKSQNEAKIIALARFKVYRIAAAVAFLIMALSGFWMMQTKEKSVITVSEETIDSRLSPTNLEDDNQAVAILEEMCRVDLPKCETPDFKNLKSEFDELNTAKEKLISAIGNYNDNPDLVIQLTEIENMRSTLIRKMITL